MRVKNASERLRLSAVIITKNEAHNISGCLASLSFCDEVIVVDNMSQDGTREFASDLGAKVIEADRWLGFGPQKQLALESASGQWILSIDADERVSPRLQAEILAAVRANGNLSFKIERENYFLGKHMRFGGWANDRVLRLAKRGHCRFSSDLVHESLICEHPARTLAGTLTHLSYRSVGDVFNKQIQYARLGAQKITESGQRKKSPALSALWTFIRLYFFQLGFLDGWRGTLAAAAKSYETFWRYTLADQDRYKECTSE